MSRPAPVYDEIGGGYASGQREDPRIATPIWAALGDATSVVNVGAGVGSYEPKDRRVVAVEPSEVVISQRPLVPEAAGPWWLYDYFPATARLVASRETPLREYEAAPGPVQQIPVPIPADCIDGFEAAFWRRPGAILDPAAWQAMSAIALIPGAEREAGMRRLRADLEAANGSGATPTCSSSTSSIWAAAC